MRSEEIGLFLKYNSLNTLTLNIYDTHLDVASEDIWLHFYAGYCLWQRLHVAPNNKHYNFGGGNFQILRYNIKHLRKIKVVMNNGQDCVAGGQKLILKPRITITCSSIAETLMWKEASNGVSYKMYFFFYRNMSPREYKQCSTHL